jgi:hypothetical protein
MIYGTHNSGTYGDLQMGCSCLIEWWTQNQTLSIQEQLEQGVRYFDFRVSYSTADGQLYLSHSLLTTNTVTSVFNELTQFLEKNTNTGLVFIHLRVDYKDRSNAGIIEPIMASLLDYHQASIMSKSDLYVAGEQMDFDTACSISKILIHCTDGTIQHRLVHSADLMPTVFFWNAGTVEECERRIQHLEDEFNLLKDGPFLFHGQRMLMFDYSNEYPLWITDRQQFSLMDKYKNLILRSRVTILAGNHIEKIMALFS